MFNILLKFFVKIHNNDGYWLKLNSNTIRKYCNAGYMDAWCLQYHQHLGKTLLVSIEGPKSTLEEVTTETLVLRNKTEINEE